MSSCFEIDNEIASVLHQTCTVRNKYLNLYHEKTKRNVVAYYSGWLQSKAQIEYGFNDLDVHGFMAVLQGLPKEKGLDLILHTPGGFTTVAEKIIDYLHSLFDGDVRCIVPQLAMSAGTMIACSSKEILMGKHSCLGPIDPSFGNFSCHEVVHDFEKAYTEIKKDPATIPYWTIILNKYPPAFYRLCKHSIALSNDITEKYLLSCMLKDEKDATEKTKNILDNLNSREISREHGRHLSAEYMKELGLKVKMLEDDKEIQDLILSIHHAFMNTLNHTLVGKIIENHNGKKIVNSSQINKS